MKKTIDDKIKDFECKNAKRPKFILLHPETALLFIGEIERSYLQKPWVYREIKVIESLDIEVGVAEVVGN